MLIDTISKIYQYFYTVTNNNAQNHKITEVERDLGKQYSLTQKSQKSLLNTYWSEEKPELLNDKLN